MNNNATTLEGDLLRLTQLELVTPTTVAGALYGIAFTLFCLYVHALVPRLQDEDRKRRVQFMLVFSIVVMLCGLYNLVANAWAAQDAYIKHGNFPGGPYAYIESTLHTPVIIIGLACQTAIDMLTSAIQIKIWRVWVVWSRGTRYVKLVVVPPILCFLTWTALKLRAVILETALPFTKHAQPDLKTQTATISIQGATTILCTLLISLFLLFHEWQQRKLAGEAQGSTGYMKIVAMLIESYMLESIWLLIIIVRVNAFFAETVTYIEIIAYLLVQYRVARGTSYESQGEQSYVSSLHWIRPSNHVDTQLGASLEADGDTHEVWVKREASEMVPVASRT